MMLLEQAPRGHTETDDRAEAARDSTGAIRRLLAHRAPLVRTEVFAVPKPMLTTARLASYWRAVTSQIYLVNARKLREGESDADQIDTIPFLMAK